MFLGAEVTICDTGGLRPRPVRVEFLGESATDFTGRMIAPIRVSCPRRMVVIFRPTSAATGDQWDRGRSSSGGLRRTIGCFLVFCNTMNAIVPQTAGTHSEMAWYTSVAAVATVPPTP